MEYVVKENSNVRQFDRLSIGDLFLSKDKKQPFIKIADVSCYGDIHNCIKLGTGDGWNFRGDEEVISPGGYELKIFL